MEPMRNPRPALFRETVGRRARPSSAGESGRFQAGFTLIELLAVCAIVSILLALSLTGLSSLTERSESVRCLSNLRQIGMAARLFGDEHNGIIVATYFKADPDSPGKYWWDNLSPHLGSAEAAKKTLRCPTSVRKHPNMQGVGITYSLNSFIAPHHITAPEAPLRRFAEATHPKDLILAAHGAWIGDRYASNMTFGGQCPEPLHHGKSNILFLDGHVETLPPEIYKQQRYWRLPAR